MMFHLKKHIPIFLALLGLFTLVLSCNSDDNNNEDGCGNSICTEEFRSYDVSVISTSQDAVALDEFVVTWVETGKDLTVDYSAEELEVYQLRGQYPLISDAFVSDFKRRVISLTFEGYINGELVVDEDYTVAFDCCHVFLVEGDLLVELGID